MVFSDSMKSDSLMKDNAALNQAKEIYQQEIFKTPINQQIEGT